MQNKYEANFVSLTNEEAEYFADAICGVLSTNVTDNVETVDGAQLFAKLVEHDVDHKTACMSLANDPSPMAVSILEKVVGQPVRKQTPVVAGTTIARPKTEGAPRPKLAKNDPRVIYDVIPNPKRAGSKSFERYNFYKEGMTVTEFLAAGGTTGDVQHDVGKGFIKLREAE